MPTLPFLPEGLDLPFTLRVLRLISAHPYLDLFRLLFPIPWTLRPPLPLPRPQAFAHDRALFDARHPLIPQIRLVPLFRARDSAQASLYRIYEALCARDGAAVASETEYFWRRGGSAWALGGLAEPRGWAVGGGGGAGGAGDDPVRCAVLASLVEALVDAFNWRLGMGLRRGGARRVERADDGTSAPFVPEVVPEWVGRVAALEDELVIAEGGTGPRFAARNIVAFEGDLRTV